ncbi:beta-lactamase family protein [Amycolatopsis sp. NBC_01307]|uniref:serine hydrolase domain-containing protein n=1 Tax=Amycolatopsis sp. NBC_01307 TaxID=2903561 RepID=UPI002E10220C|nr:beta-lactamase family protein [Amycolatopsis sp. NBC_01307]
MRRTALVAAVIATAGLTTATQAAASTPLERLARNLVAAGAPGVIVRVDDGRGRPVEIAEHAPWAHRLEAGDEFRMGSNTKTVMATITLQLVAEHRLALSDCAGKWLPGTASGVTLRMLLNHTSGLSDYAEDPALRNAILGKDPHRWTAAELFAVGAGHPPLFAPGTDWSYSNTNYAAIGVILERVTGASLADLVRDRIARPLHLAHTYLPADGSWRGRHAHGYEPDAAHMPPSVPAEFTDVAGTHRAGHVDVSGNDPGWGASAGAIVSSAPDWARFYTALMSGKLLPAAQLAEMRTVAGPGYGLGILTATTPCGTFWGHDGGITGYSGSTITDSTGRRTATILVPTEFRYEFDADPALAEAQRALQNAVTCAMFGKPVSAGPAT